MKEGSEFTRLTQIAGGFPYLRTDLHPKERFLVEPANAPGSLESAYAAIRRLTARSPADWRGWKLGGSNHATQVAFGVEDPYFGPLHRSEILRTPRRAPGLPLCELKGEVEIALRIGPDGRRHDAWAVALEMPASAVANLPRAGVAALVADRCGAGALVLGPIHQGALPDCGAVRFGLYRGATCLSEAGIEALIDAPERLLAGFVDAARALGFAPRPGDWVATGGITACCGFTEGERILVRADDDPVLDLVVSAAAHV